MCVALKQFLVYSLSYLFSTEFVNPFALFILKEANGFVTLHCINFLTPKSSRPGGNANTQRPEYLIQIHRGRGRMQMQEMKYLNIIHARFWIFIGSRWIFSGGRWIFVLV